MLILYDMYLNYKIKLLNFRSVLIHIFEIKLPVVDRELAKRAIIKYLR